MTIPNHTWANEQRAAGKIARLLWEIPGPKDTEIAWLSCYAFGTNVAIVETFKDKNGYMVLTDEGGPEFDNELRALASLPALKESNE
jgi:hypothetical protein